LVRGTWLLILAPAMAWVAPAPASGGALVITPTFDSSITGDPNAAAIEAMITNAINVFESYRVIWSSTQASLAGTSSACTRR
jgi:hypothetical protein